MHARRIRVSGEIGPVESMKPRPLRQSETCVAPLNSGDGVCGRPTVGKSLCKTHLRRLQRNGTLTPQRVFAHT